MYITITEVVLPEKLKLEKFLARWGIRPIVRDAIGGFDVLFLMSDNLKIVVGSDNIELVDDQALNSIILDRNVFFEIKIQ